MRDVVTSAREIPKAESYVLCDDKFMSGWGDARGLTNTLIFTCDSYEEAMIVSENASNRSDTRRVRICMTKPRLRQGHLYQVKTKESYPTWYEKGAF
jgi:hypothetical protein